MTDFSLPARKAIMARLKHDGTVASLVPDILRGTVPAGQVMPFIRINPPIASPFLASCLNSSAMRFSVQGFTKDVIEGGVVTVPAEDRAYQVGAAIKDALDGATLAIEGGKLRLSWVNTIVTQDRDEAGAWMVSCIFNGEVAG